MPQRNPLLNTHRCHTTKPDKAGAQVREARRNSIAVCDVIDELLLRQPPFMRFADSREEILKGSLLCSL